MPISQAILRAGAKPVDSASRSDKQKYAQRLSNEIALVVADSLRSLGAHGCLPDPISGGKERQFAGSIGAKKVDVSLATETAGLILAVSIKTINFKDSSTGNYQKNLTNRRGDILAEATTLHQRFPYAVVGGMLFFEDGAAKDGTQRRPATFVTAHEMFAGFTGRQTRSDGAEMMEAMALCLYTAAAPHPYVVNLAGDAPTAISLDDYLKMLLEIVAKRNPDHFRFANGRLTRR